MAWALRTDEKSNPDENEEPGARVERLRPYGWKKRRPGGLVGKTGGDALTLQTTKH
jgi:hypothetical protein